MVNGKWRLKLPFLTEGKVIAVVLVVVVVDRLRCARLLFPSLSCPQLQFQFQFQSQSSRRGVSAFPLHCSPLAAGCFVPWVGGERKCQKDQKDASDLTGGKSVKEGEKKRREPKIECHEATRVVDARSNQGWGVTLQSKLHLSNKVNRPGDAS